MKRFRSPAGVLSLVVAGLCVAPIVVYWREVRAAIDLLGFLLLPLAALHAVPVLLDSRGWLRLLRLPGPSRPPSAGYVWGAALIREAICNITPLSGVGAFAAAVRLLRLRGVGGADAVASIVVETTLTLATQFGLMLAAVAAWLSLTPAAWAMAAPIAGVIALGLVPVGAVLYLQRSRSLPDACIRLLRRASGAQLRALSVGIDAVYGALDRFYSSVGSCAVAGAWQAAGLAGFVAELWLMLALLQMPHPLLVALSLSGVARLARSLFAYVPAGLGVQEIAFGALMMQGGLDFGAGVAISIATRARDVLFGTPMLVAWLRLEREYRRERVAEEAPALALPGGGT